MMALCTRYLFTKLLSPLITAELVADAENQFRTKTIA
jgi:hypothetical protein